MQAVALVQGAATIRVAGLGSQARSSN